MTLSVPLQETLDYLLEHGASTTAIIHRALAPQKHRSGINNRLVALQELGLVEPDEKRGYWKVTN